MNKSSIPYCREGEPSEGCSSIQIRIFGATLEEVMERFIRERNEKRQIGEHSVDEQPSRVCITWTETMAKLADVVRPSFGGWRKRR